MKISSEMPYGYTGNNGVHINKGQQNIVSKRQNRDVLSISAKGEKNNARLTEEGLQNESTHRATIEHESELARKSRIEKIKVDIQNGNYAVSNDLIVDAIINKSSGR